MNCFFKKTILFIIFSFCSSFVFSMKSPHLPKKSGKTDAPLIPFVEGGPAPSLPAMQSSVGGVLSTDSLSRVGDYIDRENNLDGEVSAADSIDIQTLITHIKDDLRGNEQDIKGIMLLMVLHEHIFESYFAKGITLDTCFEKENLTKADWSADCVCCFDKHIQLLLSLEIQTFDQLSENAQQLWRSFEQYLASKGFSFDTFFKNNLCERSFFFVNGNKFLNNLFVLLENKVLCSEFFTFLGDDGVVLLKENLVALTNHPRFVKFAKCFSVLLTDIDKEQCIDLKRDAICNAIKMTIKFFKSIYGLNESKIDEYFYFFDTDFIETLNNQFCGYLRKAYAKIDRGQQPSFALWEILVLIHDFFTESFETRSLLEETCCNTGPREFCRQYPNCSFFRDGYRRLYGQLAELLPETSQRIIEPVVFPVERIMLLPRHIFLLHEASKENCVTLLSAIKFAYSTLDLFDQKKLCIDSDIMKNENRNSAFNAIVVQKKTGLSASMILRKADYLNDFLEKKQSQLKFLLNHEGRDDVNIGEMLFDTDFFDMYHALVSFGLWQDGLLEQDCAPKDCDDHFFITVDLNLPIFETRFTECKVIPLLRWLNRRCDLFDEFFRANPVYPKDLLSKKLFILNTELMPFFKYHFRALTARLLKLEHDEDVEQMKDHPAGEFSAPLVLKPKQKAQPRGKTRKRGRGRRSHVFIEFDPAIDGSDDECEAGPPPPDSDLAKVVEDCEAEGFSSYLDPELPPLKIAGDIFSGAIAGTPPESTTAAGLEVHGLRYELFQQKRRDIRRRPVTILFYEDIQSDRVKGLFREYYMERKHSSSGVSGDLWHNEVVDAAIEHCLCNGFGNVYDSQASIEEYNKLFNEMQKVSLDKPNLLAVVIEAKVGSDCAQQFFKQNPQLIASVRGNKMIFTCRDIHCGAVVFLFDTETKTCFHQCFHEFKESFHFTHDEWFRSIRR